jgi:hypothetical protein
VIASYTGRARLVAEGSARTNVMVHIEVRRLERFSSHLQAGWAGQITAGMDAFRFVGEKVDIELPNGRIARVAVLDSGGNFTGIGDPPL